MRCLLPLLAALFALPVALRANAAPARPGSIDATAPEVGATGGGAYNPPVDAGARPVLASRIFRSLTADSTAAGGYTRYLRWESLVQTSTFTRDQDAPRRPSLPDRFTLSKQVDADLRYAYVLDYDTHGILRVEPITLVHPNGVREELVSFSLDPDDYNLRMGGIDRTHPGTIFHNFAGPGISTRTGPNIRGDHPDYVGRSWGYGGHVTPTNPPVRYYSPLVFAKLVESGFVGFGEGGATYQVYQRAAGTGGLLLAYAGQVTHVQNNGGYVAEVEPFRPAAAGAVLAGLDWTDPLPLAYILDPIAHYSGGPNGASASKLRYQVPVTPGAARTVTWLVTFTPEGAGGPTEYRVKSAQVAAGATATDEQLLDPFAWMGAVNGTYKVVAIVAELAVDANRDGTIKLASEDASDATSTDKPYRIWINDDFDRYGVSSPPENGAIPDYSRESVGTGDDFKDFFPVFLNIKQLVSSLPPLSGSGIVYKLKQADEAVKFFYTALTKDQAFTFRNSLNIYMDSSIRQITRDGYVLDREFLLHIRDDNQGVILVEGTKATTQPLILTVEKDGVTIAEVSIPLSIGQDIVLLLHGMNSSVHTWNEFVNRFFGNFNSANIVDGDFDRILPPKRNREGVRCYRLQFGAYEAQNNLEGLQGVTAAKTPNYLSDPLTKCGDFENFFTLGREVSDAIKVLTKPFPNARILLVGHSRGGLAGRIFLQDYAQSEGALAVVGLLTTSSPHLGSPMGRIYNWLKTHPEGPQDDRALDWFTVAFLSNASVGIDVRRPVIRDVADDSDAIRDLNQHDSVARLPTNSVAGGGRAQFGYSAIVYNKAKLGTLLGGEAYTLYSVLGPSIGIGLPTLSDSAAAEILGDQTIQSLSGDGLVPSASQTFFSLSGFSGRTAKPTLEVTNRQVVHIQAPKELDDLLTQLNVIMPDWIQYE